MDDMDIWQIIVQSLATSAVIGGLAVFIVKKWIETKFKENEQANQHDLDEKLEQLRSKLSLENQKLLLKQTTISEPQAQTIRDIFKQLINLNADINKAMNAYNKAIKNKNAHDLDSSILDTKNRADDIQRTIDEDIILPTVAKELMMIAVLTCNIHARKLCSESLEFYHLFKDENRTPEEEPKHLKGCYDDCHRAIRGVRQHCVAVLNIDGIEQ